MPIVAGAVAIALVSLIVVFSLLGRAKRKRFLETLPALAKGGLVSLAADVFDSPDSSVATSDPRGATIEGTVGGVAIKVSSSFPSGANSSYMSSGSTMAVVAELVVTVGLRGATPRFRLSPKRSGRDVVEDMYERLMTDDHATSISDEEFAKVCDVDVGSDVIQDLVADQDVRRALLRFILRNRTVQSISVTPEGLAIRWTGEAGLSSILSPKVAPEVRAANEKMEAARIKAAATLAIDLQRRIIERLERRVRVEDVTHYRGPVPEQVSARASEDEQGGAADNPGADGDNERSSASQS